MSDHAQDGRARRAWAASQALANVRLEHLDVDQETRTGLEEFVDGRTGLEELERRLRERYGLAGPSV